MKKYIFLLILLVLFLDLVCQAADIENETQLKSAADTGGTYTIAPGTYDLTDVAIGADLTFATNTTITHDGTAGNVTIDGSDTYKTIFKDAARFIISGISDSKRIIFTQGDDYSCLVYPQTSVTSIIFDWCDFSEGNTNDGISIRDSDGAKGALTCNNCRAFNNGEDGFSLSAGTVNNEQRLFLNDCEAYGNTENGVKGGVTPADWKHFIYISGGSYHDNTLGGIALSGGENTAYLYVGDANIYDNGEVGLSANCIGVFSNLTFSTTSGSRTDQYATVGYYSRFHGCTFNEVAVTTGTKAYIGTAADSLLVLEGCLFLNGGSDTYGIYTTSTTNAVISNSVFYNFDYRGVRVNSRGITFNNNIFMNCVRAINFAIANVYSMNQGSGYNCFFGNTYDISADTGGLFSTDVEADPQFMDAANGDFRLNVNSPCLNTGKPTIGSGKTTIGAWQPNAITQINYRSRYDFEDIYSN